MARQKHSYPWDIWKESQANPPLAPRQRKPVTEQDAERLERKKRSKLPHGNTKNVKDRIKYFGDYAEIHTFAGVVAIIDIDDVDKVRDYPWCATTGGYLHAYKRGTGGTGRVTIALHRLIMDAPPGSIVDHIDGDPANNRKSNLRFVTASQNTFNRRPNKGRSLPKGVKYLPHAKAYAAYIGKDYRNYCLKMYKTAEEAAAAYNTAAKILHGEYARLNTTPIESVDFNRRANKYSPYKGANWNPKYQVWYGQISLNGRTKYLGRFSTDVEAAKAYDKAAKDIFGSGAILNFPDEPIQEGPIFFLRKFNSQRTDKSRFAKESTESQPVIEQ